MKSEKKQGFSLPQLTPAPVIAASVLATLVAGCGPRIITFTRKAVVSGSQELPASVRRVDVLPVVVGPVKGLHASFADEIGMSATMVEGKIVEALLEKKRHQATVLRSLVTDIPNWKEVIEALVGQGIVSDELKNALKKRSSPPDAILGTEISVTPTKATGGREVIEKLTGIFVKPPERAAVRAKFLVHSTEGALLAAFSSFETCSTGHVDRDMAKLVGDFVDRITYCERQQKYSLFYDSPETESASRMLMGVGQSSFITAEDLKPAREMLVARLARQPDDDCAVYLMGVVHEFLGDWPKAREYYNKALALAPVKGYSEGVARIAAVEQHARMGDVERQRVEEELKGDRGAKEEGERRRDEGKDYKELLRDR